MLLRVASMLLLLLGIGTLLIACASSPIAAFQLQIWGFGMVIVAVLLRMLHAMEKRNKEQ